MASSSDKESGGASMDLSAMYCSEPFKFIVDCKPFYVHADLIQEHYKPLDRMIRGPMIEAQQGFAIIEGVQQRTFHRFVQWLYKGYYYAEEPSGQSQEAQLEKPIGNTDRPDIDLTQSIDLELSDSWGRFGSKKKKGKKSTWRYSDEEPALEGSSTPGQRTAAKERFVQRKYLLRNISKDHPQPKPNMDKGEDYSEVFLSHARLYVFADQYEIQALKVLAMEELHAVLAVFTLYKERTGDIISLLRYIYTETDEKVSEDNLRTLISRYVEAEIETLIHDDTLENLLIEDEGTMLTDFLVVMRRKLASCR